MNRGDLALATVMVIFGLTFIAIKIALQDLGPLTIALIRFLIATILLLPVAGPPRDLPLKTIFLMGLTGVAAFYSLQNIGLVYTTASNASLILASIPAMTAILSCAFLGEHLTRTKTTGITLSMAGVALIVVAGGATFDQSSIGDLLILLGALSWAAYTIIGKTASEHSTMRVTAYTMLTGTLLLAPLAAGELRVSPVSSVHVESIASVLFLGVLGSAGAFFLYNWALRHVSASRAAIYTNLSPLITVIAGVLYLHEPLYPLQVAGGVMVLVGITLHERT